MVLREYESSQTNSTIVPSRTQVQLFTLIDQDCGPRPRNLSQGLRHAGSINISILNMGTKRPLNPSPHAYFLMVSCSPNDVTAYRCLLKEPIPPKFTQSSAYYAQLSGWAGKFDVTVVRVWQSTKVSLIMAQRKSFCSRNVPLPKTPTVLLEIPLDEEQTALLNIVGHHKLFACVERSLTRRVPREPIHVYPSTAKSSDEAQDLGKHFLS